METVEQQQKDSDMIFNQITHGDFDKSNYQNAVVQFYVTDMSISRAGISHALKRLENYYKADEK